jgi:hypothetical protein
LASDEDRANRRLEQVVHRDLAKSIP